MPECPGISPSQNMCPINPATKMPYEEYLQRDTDESSANLSSSRENSTIPKADTESNWQYPSARMFYNALNRKGQSVSAESINDILFVHNRLNESVWQEIAIKEKLLHPQCEPKLKRFMGRPKDLSPRAWWHVNVRGGEPPFDRHDWVIDRCGCEVRYVIDYYSGHPEPDQASFNVDIRPALDSPQALLDRFKLFWNKCNN